jgi:hypothetical protein
VKHRPNSGIIVETSHANRNLITFGQSPPNKLEPQFTQNAFTAPFAVTIYFDQLSTLQQPKLLFPNARLSADSCARMFTAAIAVAVTRPDQRRIHLEAHAAAQTTAPDHFRHCSILWQPKCCRNGSTREN